MFSPRLIKLVACVALIALLPTAAGCYGSFPLTHMVYKFNGEITEYKVVHAVVFWAFIIIPVYWIGFLGDAIVLNLIEFWTGEKMTSSSQILPDGTHAALAPSADGSEATLTVSRDGEVLQQVRFVRISEKEVQVFNEAGRKVGFIFRAPSSGLVLMDAQGAAVATIRGKEISRFRAAMERLDAPPPQAADGK